MLTPPWKQSSKSHNEGVGACKRKRMQTKIRTSQGSLKKRNEKRMVTCQSHTTMPVPSDMSMEEVAQTKCSSAVAC